MLSSEGSAKKSKKALKRKVSQKDGGEYGSRHEAELNITGTTEAQAVSSLGLGNENGAAEEKESNRDITSWVQRASWKSLVGETGRVAFSLGSVLDNVTLSVASMEQPSTTVNSSNNVSAWIDGTNSSPLLKPPTQSNGAHVKKAASNFKNSKSQSTCGPSIQQCVGTEDAQCGLRETTDHENAEKLTSYKEVSPNHYQNGVEKSCTFMRSENYEQEWLEAKRAVKEIFKRTRKDALRSIKMFHTRHTT